MDTLTLGRDLSRAQADGVMEEILGGHATYEQIKWLLKALYLKDGCVEELVGFATAMRRHAAPVFRSPRTEALPGLVDTCGTGGDASGTFNISTCAAFVVAGAGARVAKHGNRSISSRAGSADVLEALGVPMDIPLERMGDAVEQIGIGFFFAPLAHSATKHAMRARRELKVRTIFNLLGPLTNPAGARAQLAGAFNLRAAELVAGALAKLGTEHAFVVHGADGLDEISISGATHVAEVRGLSVRSYSVTPKDFEVERSPIEQLAGGDAAENATILRGVLAGERGARRDVVLANASAALVAAGCAADFREGVRRAAESIDSGAGAKKLQALIKFSQDSRNPADQKAVT